VNTYDANFVCSIGRHRELDEVDKEESMEPSGKGGRIIAILCMG